MSSSSSGPQLDVLCLPSPTSDMVVTWATDIHLYRMRRTHEQSHHRRSLLSQAELVLRVPDPPHYMKCVALSPASGHAPYMNAKLAVGHANGRISLLSLGEEMSCGNNPSHLIKQFTPRALRPCHHLAWNQAHSHLLAAGYEKARTDCGILVFDVEKSATTMLPSSSTSSMSSRFNLNRGSITSATVESSGEFVRAVVEVAQGETCHSLAWCGNATGNMDMDTNANVNSNMGNNMSSQRMNQQPNILIAGMNNKNLKVYDVRADQISRASSSTFTRAVHKLCIDPFLEYRVASQCDNQVVIWDTRNFERPIVTLNQSGRVIKLAWSPTRAGLLCSAVENSSDLTIHDIQSWAVMTEDGEPAVTERMVSGHLAEAVGSADKDTLSSFAWHESEENVIVVVSREGQLREVKVTERMAPSWSATHCLLWPHGGKLRIHDRQSKLFDQEDESIALLMQHRAQAGYGASHKLEDNCKFVESAVLNVPKAWSWLSSCSQLMSDASFANKFSRHATFPGVRTALGMDTPPGICLRADITYLPWNGVECPEGAEPKKKKVYRNESRERAQKLCGWTMDPTDLNAFISNCERVHEFSRGAAVSIFCLEMGKALRVLETGVRALEMHDERVASAFNMVALSLAGYCESRSSLWRQKARQSSTRMADPYLRAMFTFLIADNDDDYDPILDDDGIHIADRVAFACIYLSDNRLRDAIDHFWTEHLRRGDLNGILLCGMSVETVELLQRYIDLTGDVQTACWLVIRGMPPKIVTGIVTTTALSSPSSMSATLQNWLDAYRELLDMWRLWILRAEFDIAVNRAQMMTQPLQQVYVSCTFCGAALSQYVRGMPTKDEIRTNSLNRMVADKTAASASKQGRIQACGSCQKPLPRCVICLVTMGSHAGRFIDSVRPSPGAPKVAPFEDFFTWCQNCRHGGHSQHISGWFMEHNECAVSGCSCQCASLDYEE